MANLLNSKEGRSKQRIAELLHRATLTAEQKALENRKALMPKQEADKPMDLEEMCKFLKSKGQRRALKRLRRTRNVQWAFKQPEPDKRGPSL